MVSTRSSSSKRSPSPKQSRSQRLSSAKGDELNKSGELNIEQSIAPLTDRPENLVDSIIEEVQEKPEPIVSRRKLRAHS